MDKEKFLRWTVALSTTLPAMSGCLTKLVESEEDSTTQATGTGQGTGTAGDSASGGNTGGASAGETTGGAPIASNCCEAREEKGCSNSDVATCVCTTKPECCSDEWTLACVVEAVEKCSNIQVEGEPVVNEALCIGNCCQENGDGEGGGCQNQAIEECVCAADSSCCEPSLWAFKCRQVAETQCGIPLCSSWE